CEARNGDEMLTENTSCVSRKENNIGEMGWKLDFIDCQGLNRGAQKGRESLGTTEGVGKFKRCPSQMIELGGRSRVYFSMYDDLRYPTPAWRRRYHDDGKPDKKAAAYLAQRLRCCEDTAMEAERG
ncbi:hypothetical protein U1Q18_049875, partial [Sarracenia purpurea var. burkii]